jgi:hypothetical protein
MGNVSENQVKHCASWRTDPHTNHTVAEYIRPLGFKLFCSEHILLAKAI